MMRLAWLQSRTQSAVAAAGLAVVAVASSVTGPHLVHLYDTTVAPCHARGDCSAAISAFITNDAPVESFLALLLLAIPAVIGLFWGAPLVAREIETGTFRLVWTQSVTRTRWVAVKLGVVGVASMAVTGLLSLFVTWWSSPLDRATGDAYRTFDQRGVVPIGYAAFAFVLGVVAGVVIRRIIPAMATTLVAFIGARYVVDHWIRAHLVALAQLAAPLDPGTVGLALSNKNLEPGPLVAVSTLVSNSGPIPNGWVHSVTIVDRGGHPLTPHFVATACPQLANMGSQTLDRSRVVFDNCVTTVGATFHELITYQPASHYWAFQWSELAIYLAGALVLAGACCWGVRRRVS